MAHDSTDPAPTLKQLLRSSLVALLLAPFLLVVTAAGLVFLWENAWLWRWVWIPVPCCWLLAFLLYRIAKRRYGPLWQPRAAPLSHWTDRDTAAWQLVVDFADRTERDASDRVLSPDLYWETARELAQVLAGHYHPGARDAIENLTIPEILTAAELAIGDTRVFVERHIPGSHLMTVRWIQRAPRAARWWQTIRPLYVAAIVWWHPWTALSRAAADETVVSPVWGQFKRDSLAVLYRIFALQMGKYLIELNSHRLREGPERWRQLFDARRPAAAEPAAVNEEATGEAIGSEPGPPSPPAQQLRVAVIGQVKAGKSSLVNALLGDQFAAEDSLPLTNVIAQYSLTNRDMGAAVTLLDTVGYAHQGPKSDQWAGTLQAVCRSAMTLLVMQANQPARAPDLAMLDALEDWFRQHPHRRRPPVLVVLTHIDRLSPAAEWQPPYDGWVHPHSPCAKEQSMREAVTYVRELLGNRVAGVVPVCTDMARDRQYGVQQWVLPALLNLLPQAKSKQLLDALYDRREASRVTQLMTQLYRAASLLAQYQFCGTAALVTPPEQE